MALGGNLNITTSNDTITLGAVTGANKTLTVNSNGAAVTLGDIGASNAKLTSLTVSGNGTLSSAGNWFTTGAISAANNALTTTDTLSIASGNLTLNNISLDDTLTIISTGSVQLGNIIGNGVNLDIETSVDNHITFGNLGLQNSSLGNVELTVFGNGYVKSQGNWYTGVISGNAKLNVTDDLTINSGAVDFGNIFLQGALSITSSNGINVGIVTGAGEDLTLISGNNGDIDTGSLGTDSAQLGTITITPDGSGSANQAGTLYYNEDTVLGSINLTGDTIIVTSDDDLTLGVVKGNHNLTLETGSGVITLTNIGESGTNLKLLTLTTTGGVSASGTWYISTITANVPLTVTNALTINSGSTTLGNTVLQNTLTITSSGDVSIGNITGPNQTLTINASGNNITVGSLGQTQDGSGNSRSLGNVTLNTTANLITNAQNWFTANLTANNNFTFNNSDPSGLTINSNDIQLGNISTNKALTISAAAIDMGTVALGSDLTITGSGTIDIENITGNDKGLSITSSGDNHINLDQLGTNQNSLGAVTLSHSGNGETRTGSNWYIGQLSGNSPYANSADVTITATGVSLGPITMADDLEIITQSGGNILIGNLTGNHNLTLNSGSGNVTLSSIGSTSARLPIPSITSSGTLYASGSWFFNNEANLVMGDLTLNGDLSITMNNKDVTLANISSSSNNPALLISNGNGNITIGNLGSNQNNKSLGTVTFSSPSILTTNANAWHIGALTISNGTSFTFDNSNDINISANDVTLGNITHKAGAKAITLSGAATTIGNMVLANDFSLTASGATAIGNITGAGKDLTIISSNNDNITLGTLGANGSSLGNVTLTSTDTINTDASNWYTADLNMSGSGSFTFNNTNAINISAGAITLGNVTHKAGAKAITLSGAATTIGNTVLVDDFSLTATGTTSIGNVTGAAQNLTIASGANNITVGALGASGNGNALGTVILTSSETINTGASNWYTADLNMSGNGSFTFNNTSAINISAGAITLGNVTHKASAGVITLSGAATSIGNMVLANNFSLTASGATAIGNITGAGKDLTVISSNNDNITLGTLGANGSSLGDVALTSTGTINTGASNWYTADLNMSGNGSFTFNNTSAINISAGAITLGNVTHKAGAGAITLSGAATNIGNMVLANNFSLTASGATAIGNITGAGKDLTVISSNNDNITLGTLGANGSSLGDVTLTSTGTINTGASNWYTADLNMSGNSSFTFNNTSAINISAGAITLGNVTHKAGAKAITLSGAATSIGNMVLANNFSLTASGATAIGNITGAGKDLTVISSNNDNITLGTLGANGSSLGDVALTSTGTINTGASNWYTADLNMSGNGSFTFNNTSAINISAGAITLGNVTHKAGAGAITLSGAATNIGNMVLANNFSLTASGATAIGNITGAGKDLTVISSNNDNITLGTLGANGSSLGDVTLTSTGTINTGASNWYTADLNMSGNSSFTFNNTSAINISASAITLGNVTHKAGAKAITLSGAATSIDNMVLANNFSLTASGATAIGNITGAGKDLTVISSNNDNITLGTLGANGSSLGDVTLTSTGTINTGASNWYTADLNMSGNGSFTFNNTSAINISAGAITLGSVTHKAGAGAITLSGAATNIGNMVLANNFSLTASGATAIGNITGAGKDLTVISSNNDNITLGTLGANGSSLGDVTLTSTGTINTGASNWYTADLNMSGNGSFTFNNTSAINISAGAITLGSVTHKAGAEPLPYLAQQLPLVTWYWLITSLSLQVVPQL